MPAPFGRRDELDGDDALVFDLDLDQPRDAVWHAVATSEGLAPWIGEFDGDPASGRVEFRMTAEGDDAPPEPTTINRCTPLEGYDVRTAASDGQPGWGFVVALADRAGGGTRLTFAQRVDDVAGIDLMGAGWEYYLLRLRQHLDGGDLAEIEFGDSLANQAYYAGLFGIEPSPMPEGEGR